MTQRVFASSLGVRLAAVLAVAGATLAIAPRSSDDAETPSEVLERRAAIARDSWWAYRELRKPEPPAVLDPDWCRSDLDRFILARLEAKGLGPAPEADRLTLIRRASLDLTGLPPTPQEIAEFLADRRPDAWERLVDRLLASPHYGEKWGRHWLDLVRYADTNGFERDRDKTESWKYRDWVIAAFNRDLPYDRFLLEQLAGDELPDRSFDSIVATGYYRLGMWDDEVADLKQALADDLDGVVDITARTTLGIALGCARCHDHKGDPITQREYFAFAAYFAGVAPYKESPFNSIEARNVLRSVDRDLGRSDPEELRRRYRERREAIVAELLELERSAGLAPIDAELPDRAPADGLVAHFPFEDERVALAANAAGGPPARVLDAGFGGEGRFGRCFNFDGGDDRVDFDRPVADDFTISFWFRTNGVGRGADNDPRWFLGDGLVDGEVPGIVPDFGVSHLGNGIVAAGVGDPETFVSSGPGHNDGRWHHVAFTRHRASGEVTLFVDGVAVDRGRGGTQALDRPAKLHVGTIQTGGNPFAGAIDEVRLYSRTLSPVEVRAIATGTLGDAARAADLAAVLGAERGDRYAALQEELAALEPPVSRGEPVLAVREKGPVPPPMHVMPRGNPHLRGAEVAPGVPIVAARFPPPEPEPTAESSGRRLALARWIVDRRNPLTPRVLANRLWQHHFNAPLAGTPNDFGRLGEPPTHPELLDWIAATVHERGWSLKDMHRELLRSATYRMSSVPRPEAIAKDPSGELYSRFRMRRLTAEELRDAMLAANASLNPAMGGPGVRPPMPREVLETSSTPDEVWPLTPEETWGRRTLYIYAKRSLLHPLLSVFDLADVDSPCPVRFQTVQPTQALSMLNGEMTIGEARRLARRLEAERPGDPAGQVELGRLLVSGRRPSAGEIAEGVAFLEELRFEEGLDPAAALEQFCTVLFNLNEFLYVD